MLGRNRNTPEVLLARLKQAEGKLLRTEGENKVRASQAHEAAKASLRMGDDRGYLKAAGRLVVARRHAEIAADLAQTIQGLRVAMEGAPGLSITLGEARQVEKTLRLSGLDSERLRRTNEHLAEGLARVQQAASSLIATLDSISWGETTQGDLDAVHEELLAEIEAEVSPVKRLKRELHGPH